MDRRRLALPESTLSLADLPRISRDKLASSIAFAAADSPVPVPAPAVLLDGAGKRKDGRTPDQMRPICISFPRGVVCVVTMSRSSITGIYPPTPLLSSVDMKAGLISRANGSAYCEMENIKVAVGV